MEALSSIGINILRNTTCSHMNLINKEVLKVAEQLQIKRDALNLHCMRVALICAIIGKAMNMSHEELKILTLSGYFHDSGKREIPKDLINKPDKLNEDEWEVMKTHSLLSFDTVMKLSWLDPNREIIARNVLHHHENFDGSGYPFGLKGKEIPLHSRIISIADVFDAITNERPYRKMIVLDPLELMKKDIGIKYDSEIFNSYAKDILKEIIIK